MVGGRYGNWASSLIRARGQNQRTNLEFGDVYVFGYQPDRAEERSGLIQTQDLLPIFMVTRAYRKTMSGVNILGIPTKSGQKRMLERIKKAIDSDKSANKARAVYDIERLTRVSKDFANANKSYKWNNIKTRVVKLTPEDLEELAIRIL